MLPYLYGERYLLDHYSLKYIVVSSKKNSGGNLASPFRFLVFTNLNLRATVTHVNTLFA
ncbi:hypothetical protein VPH234P10_0035 [Vibrio phage 234P10]